MTGATTIASGQGEVQKQRGLGQRPETEALKALESRWSPGGGSGMQRVALPGSPVPRPVSPGPPEMSQEVSQEPTAPGAQQHTRPCIWCVGFDILRTSKLLT